MDEATSFLLGAQDGDVMVEVFVLEYVAIVRGLELAVKAMAG